jgi:transposase-like protein
MALQPLYTPTEIARHLGISPTSLRRMTCGRRANDLVKRLFVRTREDASGH